MAKSRINKRENHRDYSYVSEEKPRGFPVSGVKEMARKRREEKIAFGSVSFA